ncbi:MAG: sigma-70 family RNA polymerase sigma factor [Flavobacteriales bacterium]|nr:sigma-70 family RNA polymerase sigma factor [Flavobacteriales bacterium]
MPNYKKLKDQELAALIQKNNSEAACVEMMRRHKKAIYFMVLKSVRNQDDAKDIMIESFAKAFINIHQYNPQYAFSTWIYGIANNRCTDFFRKRKMDTISIDKVTSYNDGDTVKMELKNENPNMESKIIKREQFKRLYAVIDQLRPSYRSIIRLRYFKEYSYESIANEMNVSLSKVKTELWRAKKELFKIYDQYEKQYSDDHIK